MKRLLSITALLTLSVAVFAQGTFTIIRPAEGSRVREVVPIRMPRTSIPEGGYVSVYVNDRFVEAMIPQASGTEYIYNLDTKGLGLDDGPVKIELVLYLDTGARSEVLDRTSVNVIVENRSSINVPPGGFLLRYRLNPPREYTFNWEVRQSVSMISQAQAQLGSRAMELPLEAESLRLVMAVDQAYRVPNGYEGLVRVMPLPEPGKDHAYFTVSGTDEPRRYSWRDLSPIFSRITDTGREVFSDIPIYFGLEGRSGQASTVNLYLFDILPQLPEERVNPGDVWQAGFAMPGVTMEEALRKDKFFNMLPSRGSFEGVEWQDGRPTAKFRVEVRQGVRELADLPDIRAISGGTIQRVEIVQEIWFALDIGMVTRIVENQTYEALVTPGAGAGAGNGQGGATREQLGGASQMGGGAFRIGPFEYDVEYKPDGTVMLVMPQDRRGGLGGATQAGGGGGEMASGLTGGEGAGGGAATGERTGGGAGAARPMILRVRLQGIMTLLD